MTRVNLERVTNEILARDAGVSCKISPGAQSGHLSAALTGCTVIFRLENLFVDLLSLLLAFFARFPPS